MLARRLAWLAVLGAGVISLVASTHPHVFLPLWSLPGGDKLGHFVVMGSVSLAVVIGLSSVVVLGRPLGVLGTLTLVLVFVTLEEVSQMLIPGRNFSLADLFASYAGVLSLGALGGLWVLWRGRRASLRD